MFRPDAIRGAERGAVGSGGQVNYRLARNAVISEFQKGRLSRLDLCDAHPELIRAAAGVGDATSEPCPICEDATVVLVSYAFGRGLPPGGRLISTKAELERATRAANGDVSCYVVEVCPECRWNHLAHSYLVPRRTRV